MQLCRWHFFSDVPDLQHAVLANIVERARAAIEARGAFHLVLAGGRTPQIIYSQLRTLSTDWRAWSIYFGDERCLPRGDPQRNDTMARAAWLDHVPIPVNQIHSISAELGPAVGAAEYAELLADLGDFDLVFLGLGEDGHTASLFPGDAAALHSTQAAVAIDNAPKPPAQRISMSAARLVRSRAVLFIATGSDKRVALSRWRRGEEIPAALIDAPGGVDIYTDQVFT
jgi:6-phosphogluconolactonase